MSRVVARPAGTLTLPLLLLAAITTLGCGIQPWSPPGPADLDDVPLDVWLPSGPDIAASPYTVFHLNKPAYVAIFDIHPGEGVRAIHPWGPGSGQRLASAGYGMTSLGQSAPRCHPLGVSPVVYRFIVASTEPLDIEALRGDVSFRHVPGIRTRFFATGSPVRTMESLVERALPGPPSALETGEWAAYYTPYWVPPCEPRALTRLTRAVMPDSDQGETDDTADESDGEETREVPGISPPEQPGDDVRVRPPATEGDPLVTAGRLGEAEGVSERMRIPERIDAYERIRHRIPAPASAGAARAVPRSDRAGRDSRPRVERPDRVRTPRVERPERVRSGTSERPKKPSKPSKPKKDGDGAS